MKRIIYFLFIIIIAIGIYAPTVTYANETIQITLRAIVPEDFNDNLYIILKYENGKTGVFALTKHEDYMREITVNKGTLSLFTFQVTDSQNPERDITNKYKIKKIQAKSDNVFKVKILSKKSSKATNKKYVKNGEIKSNTQINTRPNYINYIAIAIIIFSLIAIVMISIKLHHSNNKVKR